MPDLLLELFSEEIPARMQARAAEDLKKLVTDALVDAGLVYEGAKAFVTPCRLALNVVGVPVSSPDTREERKGPRVGAPEQAIAGFLKAAGLRSIDEARIESDPRKGEFYVAVLSRPGRSATAIIAEIVPDVVRRFPWPKSMRWGSESLRWVRPLQSILCVFGPETEDTDVVDFEIDGLRSGRTTRGHRFMAPEAFEVRRFDDYVKKLEAARVVLDPERRREIIRTDAKTLAFAQGLELVEEEGLVEEVAGLVEWPVVLMGAFDEAFLDIPPEVVHLTIRNNQKCFVLAHASPLPGRERSTASVSEASGEGTASGAEKAPSSGSRPFGHEPTSPHRGEVGDNLSNRFLLVANLEAADGGGRIIAGNERVIAARLSDARFFWEQDKKTSLEVHAEKLAGITFHEKLGTQAKRVERIARLARELGPVVGADAGKAERSARLAKADLVTGMVGEFPEVQGVMGRYYALEEGIDPEIADAIRDHYRPTGQGDAVPTAPVSIAVALADKLDMLTSFWAIDEKPTGSKDPYALRRAALGVIRIVLEKGLRLRIATVSDRALDAASKDAHEQFKVKQREHAGARVFGLGKAQVAFGDHNVEARVVDLLTFFADRLKVQLREEGARYDLVDAVFALEGQDDLLMIVRRVEALGQFLDTDDGASLLTAYRRAANILRIEEKKDGRAYSGHADPARFTLSEEGVLFDRIAEVAAEADAALQREDFATAMSALARLRAPIDTFFDDVTVNAEDPALRENRLLLLSQIRAAMDRVADFSKISG